MNSSNKDENRLQNRFNELAQNREKALATFLMGGDPDIDTSLALCEAAIEGGGDIIEIGVPFSDPLADGPVNQRAAHRALEAGTSINDILNMVETLRSKHNELPIVLLLYYNTIYSFGISKFVQEARKKGVDGLVVPDLPFEERTLLSEEIRKSSPIFIDLLAPSTHEERMQSLLAEARGFVYCVSVSGVTGVRGEISPQLKPMLNKARRYTETPLLAGFGISTPQQAEEIARDCHGVIVGSVLVKEVEEHIHETDSLTAIMREKVFSFKKALK